MSKIALSFFVIEECGLDIINEREVYWIEFYDSLNSGYNLREGGNGIRGYKHTEEEIQKMIQIQRPRAVYALDREHNIVMEFPSASTAAKKLGTSSRLIKSVAERVNRQKTAHGYIWVYKDEYDSGVVNWDYYDNYNGDFPKAIKQFDLDGILFKSLIVNTKLRNLASVLPKYGDQLVDPALLLLAIIGLNLEPELKSKSSNMLFTIGLPRKNLYFIQRLILLKSIKLEQKK